MTGETAAELRARGDDLHARSADWTREVAVGDPLLVQQAYDLLVGWTDAWPAIDGMLARFTDAEAEIDAWRQEARDWQTIAEEGYPS